ncbi:MAG: hypothetical protein AAF959_01400 [Cyanobacteria bacterium P01_D01_bin.56]
MGDINRQKDSYRLINPFYAQLPGYFQHLILQSWGLGVRINFGRFQTETLDDCNMLTTHQTLFATWS